MGEVKSCCEADEWRCGGLLCGAGWLAARGRRRLRDGDQEQGPSQSWTITGAPKMYAAEGTVRVHVDDDANRVVDLVFHQLRPAYQAFAGTSVYVIWLVPKGGTPRSVGIMDVNDQRGARLTITTPYEDFDVVVTAERPGNPLKPSANRAFVATIDASVSCEGHAAVRQDECQRCGDATRDPSRAMPVLGAPRDGRVPAPVAGGAPPAAIATAARPDAGAVTPKLEPSAEAQALSNAFAAAAKAISASVVRVDVEGVSDETLGEAQAPPDMPDFLRRFFHDRHGGDRQGARREDAARPSCAAPARA